MNRDVDIYTWTIHIVFTEDIDHIEIWKAKVIESTSREFVLNNEGFDSHIVAGEDLQITFNAHATGSSCGEIDSFGLEGDEDLITTKRPSTTPSTSQTTTISSSTTASTTASSTSSTPTSTSSTTVSTTSTSTTSTTASTTSSTTPTTTPSTTSTTQSTTSTTQSTTPTTSPTTQTTTTQSTTAPTTTEPPYTAYMKYDYERALNLSILFYDAQRSGRLPRENPIHWRQDSATEDGADGHDLSGGWYDGGGHVKFNLPMAWSTWILNYGFLKFARAYEASGLTRNMCEMIRTPLEYLVKTWIPNEQTLYVQVGNPFEDDEYWGPPEKMQMTRPAYKVDETCPGSDVAAETAAALASGYLVLMDVCDHVRYMPNMAGRLLDAAKGVYAFAENNRGKYTDCVHEASDFYKSTGDADELSVAAAMLYKATRNESYLEDAKHYYPKGMAWEFDWNEDNVGAAVLLYELTQDDTYKEDIDAFIDEFDGGRVSGLTCGLSFNSKNGPSRYAANAAFAAVLAAEAGINSERMKIYAMKQINYLLGANGNEMSYQIGFGNNFPRRPHHRGSSCRYEDSWCDIEFDGDNPHQLDGALVAGPGEDGVYIDDRTDEVHNSVAIDYNAGFQGALAGLIQFALDKDLSRDLPDYCI